MQWRRYAPRVLDNLIWIILVGAFIFFVIGTDKFLTPFNVVNILSAAAVLGINRKTLAHKIIKYDISVGDA